MSESVMREIRFNPRAPRGARLHKTIPMPQPSKFQSTRPARGATARQRIVGLIVIVSIHAPREGRDAICILFIALVAGVSIHARPARARDLFVREGAESRRPAARPAVFQSTRPARGATCAKTSTAPAQNMFQSTRPARGAT